MPVLDTLVELVTRGRCIPVHLSPLPRLESLVAEVQAWKEGAANTFLMENSPYSLLEVRAAAAAHLAPGLAGAGGPSLPKQAPRARPCCTRCCSVEQGAPPELGATAGPSVCGVARRALGVWGGKGSFSLKSSSVPPPPPAPRRVEMALPACRQ